MLYLNVPYEEKDEAKKLGALWNTTLKTWFIPDNANPAQFEKWLYGLEISNAYYYLCLSYDSCYKCGKLSPVFAFMIPPNSNIGSGEEDEDYYYLYDSYNLLSDVTNISNDVLNAIKDFTKNYYLDFSGTIKRNYFMNHCFYCNAKHGEFYLYNESGGGFYIDETSKIFTLKINKPFHCYGDGNPINENNFVILGTNEFRSKIK